MNTTTIIGTTSNPSLWTYKLVITETATDITNQTSTIKVEHFLGRKSGAGSSYFSGAYTIKSVVQGETKTTNKSMSSGTIASGGWKSIGSHTFTVSNTGNPTTITISGQQTSSAFTPSSSSASGTFALTTLHIPPTILAGGMQEQDPKIIATGLHTTILVYNLSIKRIGLSLEFHDGASLSTYNVYNGNTLIGTSNTNEVTIDFKNIYPVADYLTEEVIDTMGGRTTLNAYHHYIDYQKPSIATSTIIKRKTSSNVGLTDNIATLKLNANYYVEDNEIGNNNTITKVEYKIWNSGTTEPNYIDITNQATISGGNVTITGYDISNIDFEKVYDYKIKITDYFGSEAELVRTKGVPTGVPVWTEFKDHVDFLKLTVKDKQILAPYTLYEGNSSRTDKDITLSDSSANYDCLEIHYNYYAGNTDHYNMVKIDEPNGKIAMLMGMYDNGTYLYEEVANYTVNGSTLERTNATRWRFATGGGNSTRTNTTTNDPSLWITKVIGYK